MERNCVQCGTLVVAGHQHVTGATLNEKGELVLESELRHYDCLPVALKDADPFVTMAREAAESGIKDEALRVHLEGVMANGR